jgi:hypothetical protein
MHFGGRIEHRCAQHGFGIAARRVSRAVGHDFVCVAVVPAPFVPMGLGMVKAVCAALFLLTVPMGACASLRRGKRYGSMGQGGE